MGIQWKLEEDRRYPIFLCDGCGQQIKGLGKIVYETDDETFQTTGTWWVFGKGDEHEHCETPRSSRQPWNDLDEFLVQIAINSGFDLRATEERMIENRQKFGI